MESREIEEKAEKFISQALDILEQLRSRDLEIQDKNVEERVWYAYMWVEASIAMIKAANKKEYPRASYNIRTLIKRDPSLMLSDASRYLWMSLSSFSNRNIDACIAELRNARNSLRTILIVTKKKRLDLKRAKVSR